MQKRRLAGLLSATALTAVLGLAGSTTGAAAGVRTVVPLAALPTITVAGSWTLTLDWYCDGASLGTLPITFAADGTWTTSTRTGRWTGGGGTILWTYSDVANLFYTAQINGGFMTGLFGYNTDGGATGCFGGVLTTAATAGTSAAKTGTDAAVTPG